MKTTSIVRHRLIALTVAAFAFAATACDIEMSMGSEIDGCLMGGCGGGSYDFPYVAADSVIIDQRDTTITMGDSLIVRFRVYPEAATVYLYALPYETTTYTWLYTSEPNWRTWSVRPSVEGTVTVVAFDMGQKSDTLLVQVTRRTP